ncbi:PTS system mannose/fructose/sorbose family transporter subunit IID [Streptococcus pneumoniae]|nr:PTS system mannose/fructose/sorbose family transporter subunit IID [Streptococcus pneumoniae]
MEQLHFITKLLDIKDPNIQILDIINKDTHKEIIAKLDYDAPSCPECGNQLKKYDFQKPSKIPYLETTGMPTRILLRKRRITKGASILGMFILAVLVQRWVNIKFAFDVSKVQLDEKAYIHWDKLPEGSKGIQEAFAQVGQGLSQTPEKVTTFQQNLDMLIPGLSGLLLTLLCMYLLKKKVSPITIILALFAVGIVAHVLHIM